MVFLNKLLTQKFAAGRVVVTVFQQYSERTHMCFHDLYCNLAKVVFHLKLLDFFGKGQRSIRRKTNITQAPGRDIKTIRYQSLSHWIWTCAATRRARGPQALGKKAVPSRVGASLSILLVVHRACLSTCARQATSVCARLRSGEEARCISGGGARGTRRRVQRWRESLLFGDAMFGVVRTCHRRG